MLFSVFVVVLFCCSAVMFDALCVLLIVFCVMSNVVVATVEVTTCSSVEDIGSVEVVEIVEVVVIVVFRVVVVVVSVL